MIMKYTFYVIIGVSSSGRTVIPVKRKTNQDPAKSTDKNQIHLKQTHIHLYLLLLYIIDVLNV